MKGLCLFVTLIVLTSVSAWTQTPANDYLDATGLAMPKNYTSHRISSGNRYVKSIGVKRISGHRALEHGGEVSGYSAENLVFPDDRVAIAVLTNQDMSNAPSAIVHKIASLLIPEDAATSNRELRHVRSIFEDLQKGQIDRTQFTANANSYFTETAVGDFESALAPLGQPLTFEPSGEQERGGMKYLSYTVKFSRKTLDVWVRVLPDGKIEQYQIATEF